MKVKYPQLYCLRSKERESKGLGFHAKFEVLNLPFAQFKLKLLFCLNLNKAGDFIYLLKLSNSQDLLHFALGKFFFFFFLHVWGNRKR